MLWPKEVPYHFNSKNDGKKVEKVMFSCILVGEDTKHYCEARINGVSGGGGHGLEEAHPCNRMETFESGP